mgnify:CR=1 FL=1
MKRYSISLAVHEVAVEITRFLEIAHQIDDCPEGALRLDGCPEIIPKEHHSRSLAVTKGYSTISMAVMKEYSRSTAVSK